MTLLPVAIASVCTTSRASRWLVVSFGAACLAGCGPSFEGAPGSSMDAGDPREGGRVGDSSSALDGRGHDGGARPVESGAEAASSQASSHASVGSGGSDGGHAADGSGVSDSGHAADGPVVSDGPLGTDASVPVDSAHDAGFASPPAVDLGTAANYVILTETGITAEAMTAITGDLGVSPAASGSITGFALALDSTGQFSTSALVTGRVFGADYAVPTPSDLSLAIMDLGHASVDASGRSPDVTELGAGNIGGLTLPRGVYAWSSGVVIPDDVTLVGSASDVWIFQIAQTLTVSAGKRIVLIGGGTPAHVFWSVAGAVTLGTSAHVEGVMVAQTSIALGTSASLKGRLLAETAVTMAAGVEVGP